VAPQESSLNPQIAALIEKIHRLESELDAELAKRRAELRIVLSMAASPSKRNCCAGTGNCAQAAALCARRQSVGDPHRAVIYAASCRSCCSICS